MTTRKDGHLVSPDGNWFWDGIEQTWKPVSAPPVAGPTAADRRAPAAAKPEPSKALSSFVGSVRSDDLVFGQTVLVWARWILIGTGLVLSFWTPTDLLTLQVQLAAIITLAFGNFYLHVQLLRGHPAIDNVVYGASIGDLCVITALVLVQGGYPSPVFVFYFAAVVGISVAFPTVLTAGYTAIAIGVYGVICLSTAPSDELPAVFTRLLMIAAIAACGNLFTRNESHRRQDAIRIHQELLDEAAESEPRAKLSQPVSQA
jgi:hypothetical protein